ncbi:RfaL protein [Mergibacter septicus]|uniref:O-antigen ligase family protein n=1 Tax=Mergibacter septicus TaxID=221402 RepID=UPI00117969A3|nr:O-antigen ligase family protein [Mergibacter septicus]AWX13215.1 RfaL protein [Mergibacter septicus]QDJ12635.1 RfaL protein [Mergibacter septicus]
MIRFLRLDYVVNFLITFYFISLLTLDKGYNYAPVGLLILAVGFLIYAKLTQLPLLKLDRRIKIIFFSFLAYFLVHLISVLIHSDSTKYLDGPSRGLLFFLLFYLFNYTGISLRNLLHAIPIGAFLTGLVACYQHYALGMERAFSAGQMPIQSGDIAMSLGVFSFAISIYFLAKNNLKISGLYFIFSLFGMLASFLSGSRGGWLAFIFLIIWVLYLNRHYLNLKVIGLFIGVMIVGLGLLLVSSSSNVLNKLDEARSEVSGYYTKKESETSVGARLELWKAAYLEIKQKPLLGWGVEGGQQERKVLAEQGKISQFVSGFGHVHNQILNNLVEQGLLGLLGLLGVFLIPCWAFATALKTTNLEIRLLASLGIIHILSVISYGATQVFFGHNSGNMFYFFVLVLFYALLEQLKQEEIRN